MLWHYIIVIFKESLKKLWLAGLLIHGLTGHVCAQTQDQTEKIKEEIEEVGKAKLLHDHEEEPDSLLHSKVQKGFIPIPIIITEPALGGLGGGLAVGYLHTNRRSLRANTPPTITGVMGGITRNKTWFVGVGHSHSFLNDHIRYAGGVIKANININFYEELPLIGTIPIGVKLNAWGLVQQLMFRIKESNVFMGPAYTYINTKNRLNQNTDHPLLDSLINTINGTSKLGMLGFKINFDNRDNVLSPNTGIYAGGNLYYNSTFFGGDRNFGILSLFSKFYVPVSDKVNGAFRFNGQFSQDGIPFYAKPFVKLRGVPAARYQGNQVMVVETQWRWNFYKSLSVLGFTGTGKAMDSLEDFGSSDWIYNYGAGARLTLKKLFNLRVGADAAWSNEDFAWYISVGSSF
jgi:hypothetical protein